MRVKIVLKTECKRKCGENCHQVKLKETAQLINRIMTSASLFSVLFSQFRIWPFNILIEGLADKFTRVILATFTYLSVPSTIAVSFQPEIEKIGEYLAPKRNRVFSVLSICYHDSMDFLPNNHVHPKRGGSYSI